MESGYQRFRPGLWPTLAALVVVTATVMLGNWQHRRANYRAGLQAQAAAATSQPVMELRSASALDPSMRYRDVTAIGVYAAGQQIWLDNRTYKSVPGYYVLTPLKFGDDTHVIVNRGWIAATRTRDVIPSALPLPGEVSIRGRLNTPPPSFLALSKANVAGPVWQNLDLDEYVRVHQIRVAPMIVEQTQTPADGLVREWPMPDFGRNTNIGYMYQWYSFAALTAVLWVVLGFRAGRPHVDGAE